MSIYLIINISRVLINDKYIHFINEQTLTESIRIYKTNCKPFFIFNYQNDDFQYYKFFIIKYQILVCPVFLILMPIVLIK